MSVIKTNKIRESSQSNQAIKRRDICHVRLHEKRFNLKIDVYLNSQIVAAFA
jgi:hypothetical protein